MRTFNSCVLGNKVVHMLASLSCNFYVNNWSLRHLLDDIVAPFKIAMKILSKVKVFCKIIYNSPVNWCCRRVSTLRLFLRDLYRVWPPILIVSVFQFYALISIRHEVVYCEQLIMPDTIYMIGKTEKSYVKVVNFEKELK